MNIFKESLGLVILISHYMVLGNFYINLENVDTKQSELHGASIDVNKGSVVRSVCVRFLVARTGAAQTIFYTPFEDNFVMQIAFQDKYGFLRINGKWIIYHIPIPIIPYVYKHLCFSRNETNYSVVSDGVLWYSFKLRKADIPTITKPVNIQKITFGPLGYPFFSGRYFLGRVSELNIFSNSFTDQELIEITKSCDRIDRGDKIFDWSNLKPSDVYIPNNVDIRYKNFYFLTNWKYCLMPKS